MVELHILPTTEEAAQAKARFVAALAKECLLTQDRFTIALSGGSTPRRLYQVLASPPHAQEMAWDRWHIFWSDERCVLPPGPSPSRRAVAVGRAAIFIHQGPRDSEHDRFIAVKRDGTPTLARSSKGLFRG